MKAILFLFLAVTTCQAQADSLPKFGHFRSMPYVISNPYDGAKYAATDPVKWQWWRTATVAGLGAISGASWGLHERISHHYAGFQAQHPNANPAFWNPAISWRNKYHGGQPENGRNRRLIWFTDAKHILVSTAQVSGFAGGVTIGIGQRRKWWKYAVDVAAFGVSYFIGNSIFYR